MDESVLASLMTELQEIKGLVTNQTQLIESLSPAKEEIAEEVAEEVVEEPTEETPEEEPAAEESKPDVDIEELDDLLQRD